MVNHCVKLVYHKARDMFEKSQTSKRAVGAKLFWNDGPQMQSIKSHCLMKVGQKRKSGSTTHLLWKTILMKLHLQKGDGGKGTGNIGKNKEGIEGKIRQRTDFREAKHAYRRLYKGHVESAGQ